MKTKLIGLTLVAIGILSGCGGSGSGTGGSSKPLASITINSSNSGEVAKGAVSSQAIADTGSASATSVKSASLLTDSSQKYSALSLALNHLKIAKSMPLSSGSTRAVTGWPFTRSCLNGQIVTGQTTNIATYAINDADNSGTLNTGDTYSVTYTACTLGTSAITFNGSTSLILNSYQSSSTPTPSNPDSGSITLGYNNFTIVDSTPSTGVTIGFDGSMTMSYSDNGTLFTASMTGASFTATVTGIGSVTYTNFTMTATATSLTETFYVDMAISMTPTGGSTGTVNISTPTTFSGPVDGNPTSGQMRIDGANGSYMTITVNGSVVTIVVFNGTDPATSTTTNWDQL